MLHYPLNDDRTVEAQQKKQCSISNGIYRCIRPVRHNGPHRTYTWNNTSPSDEYLFEDENSPLLEAKINWETKEWESYHD